MLRNTSHTAHLDAPDGAYAPIPCWTKRQWLTVVRRAVGRYYRVLIHDHLRRVTGGGITTDTIVMVAGAMASFAEHATGRHCRPSVATLAQITGASRRVVQRARRVLEMLGLARIVVDGRLRTRAERITSWQMGDRGRGWATEYALTIPQNLSDLQTVDNGTPPAGKHSKRKTTGGTLSTRRKNAVKRSSLTSPSTAFGRAMRLAHGWAGHPAAPGFVTADPAAIARALLDAVHAGWQVCDLVEAVNRQQSRTGLPVNPTNPGGWLRWLIAQHPGKPTQERRQRAEARRADREAAQAAKQAENARIEANRPTRERMAMYRARWKKTDPSTSPTDAGQHTP